MSVTSVNRCEICLDTVREDSVCLSCKHEPKLFDSLSAYYCYDGQITTLVRKLKFSNDPPKRALKMLKNLLGSSSNKIEQLLGWPDTVTYIPTRKSATGEPGIITSELLKKTSCHSELGVSNLFSYSEYSVTQKKRNRDERMRAVMTELKLGCNRVPGQRVLLVDDISTTGATLNHGARLLKLAGVKEVRGLVLAVTPRWSHSLSES